MSQKANPEWFGGKLGIPRSPCGRCKRAQCFGTSCRPFEVWFRRAWRKLGRAYDCVLAGNSASKDNEK